MKNRDMTAKPVKSDGYWNKDNDGLTKLEYAAIRFHAAYISSGWRFRHNEAIEEANNLFDELEQESSSE